MMRGPTDPLTHSRDHGGSVALPLVDGVCCDEVRKPAVDVLEMSSVRTYIVYSIRRNIPLVLEERRLYPRGWIGTDMNDV
jgi:hypothetical protein